MNLTFPWLRANLIGGACVLALIGPACGSNPSGPSLSDPEDVYIEVHVTGGFADVDFTYAVDGLAGAARGVSCVRMCDFEDGDILVRLSPAAILRLSDTLKETGILDLDGTDFGDQCCDQFRYTVRYRLADREATVQGSWEALPAKLQGAVAQLEQLRLGIIPIIVAFDTGKNDWPADPLQLRRHSLVGSVLSLEVEYGGGCAAHEFDLVAWNGWLESFPVQAGVLLAHEDHDDPCDALIVEELLFDLTPLKEAYLASYGGGEPGSTTIILRLTVPDGHGPRLIEYRF